MREYNKKFNNDL